MKISKSSDVIPPVIHEMSLLESNEKNRHSKRNHSIRVISRENILISRESHGSIIDMVWNDRDEISFLEWYDEAQKYLKKNEHCITEDEIDFLWDHYRPLLINDIKGLSNIAIEGQTAIIQLITDFLCNSKVFDSRYESKINDFFKYLMSSSQSEDHSFVVTVFRCSVQILKYISEIFNIDRKYKLFTLFSITYGPQNIMHSAFLKFFNDFLSSAFDYGLYISQLIRKCEISSISHYKSIDSILKTHSYSKPFKILRFLLQKAIYDPVYSLTAITILLNNQSYFKKNKKFRVFSLLFFKRCFQWIFVASRQNKYRNRVPMILSAISKFSDIEIVALTKTINISASTLYRRCKLPAIEHYYQINPSVYDPEFFEEIPYINFDKLKKSLIWPQEKCMIPRDLSIPALLEEYSENGTVKLDKYDQEMTNNPPMIRKLWTLFIVLLTSLLITLFAYTSKTIHD